MLPKKLRLSGRVKFPNPLLKGAAFVLRRRPNNLGRARFGVAVGTAVCKKAVLRNKMRRFIYGVIGKNARAAKPGFDVLVAALPRAARLPKKNVELELKEFLRKL